MQTAINVDIIACSTCELLHHMEYLPAPCACLVALMCLMREPEF